MFKRKDLEQKPRIYLTNPNNNKTIEFINERLGVNAAIRSYAHSFITKLIRDYNQTPHTSIPRVAPGVFKFDKTYNDTFNNKPITIKATLLSFGSKTIYDSKHEEYESNFTNGCYYDIPSNTVTVSFSAYNGNFNIRELTGTLMHELEHALYHDLTSPQPNKIYDNAYNVSMSIVNGSMGKKPKLVTDVAYMFYYTTLDEIKASSQDSYTTLSPHGDDIEKHLPETSLYGRLEEMRNLKKGLNNLKEYQKNTIISTFDLDLKHIVRKIDWGIKQYMIELSKIAALVREEYMEHIVY